MSKFSKVDSFELLNEILDEEKRILLSGEFDKLDKVYQKKLSAVEDIEALEDALEVSQVSSLKDKLQKSQSLLSAAMAGARKAKRRIQEYQQIHAGGQTYNSAGSMQKLGDGKKGETRRV